MTEYLPWPIVQLGEVSEVGAGNSAPQGATFFDGGTYPFVRMQDVGRTVGMYLSDTTDLVNEHAVKTKRLKIWPANSLLFPKSGASIFLNHRALLPRPAYVVSHLAVIEPGELLLPAFLYYYSLIVDAAQIVPDTNYPSLRLSDIEAIKIPLPPLPEQERIVAILRQADDLRRTRAQANQRAQDLLPALFYEMFGNPSEWTETTPLGEMVTFTGGGTPSRKVKEYFSGDIPWATSKDIKSRYLNDAQEHVTEEAIANSATKLIPANSILLVVKSKILMHSLPMSIITRPFCFGQDLKGMVCNLGVPPQFIVSALFAQKDSILRRARGANTEGLTLEILREILIPSLDPEKSENFRLQTEQFDVIDDKLSGSGITIETLFQSLLARAFTGELTAAWRESHRDELAQAAAERDALLGRAATPGGESTVEMLQLPLPAAQPQRVIHARLDAGLQKLLAAITDLPAYFRPQELVEPGGLSPVQTEAGLGVLAALGFVRRVQIEGRSLWRLVDALSESSDKPQELAA